MPDATFMESFPLVRFGSRLPAVFFLVLAAGLPAFALDSKDISFSGLGWVQYGRVVQSTDTAARNYNGNSVQSSGAQISLRAKVSEKFEGAAGLGVLENHYLAGNASGGRVPQIQTPYIAEASFTYSFWKEDKSNLKLTGGLFPYNYHPDIKNLGLYLLRGPVHPGILLSGFETKAVLPIANTLGFLLRHETGKFQQNLILNSETDLYPFYDVSPAYIANYQAGSTLRIGAGVNFYRFISIESKLTSPDSMSSDDRDHGDLREPLHHHPYTRQYIYVDTVSHDTTFISFRGIKLMANASFDPKPLLGGNGVFGPEDLKLYGEIALLGLDNGKAYKEIYGDYLHRMPMMVGFNIPAFGWLDNLSLEVEWYGAKFRDDLWRYQTVGARGLYPSPLPVDSSDAVSVYQVERNLKRDDWKWSLYGSKTIQGHFKISFQIADDHFRPGGAAGDILPSPQEAILSTPKDWYWMTKIAYFF
jgi:hypothetical protein